MRNRSGEPAANRSKRAVCSMRAASPRSRTSARIWSTARWTAGSMAAGGRSSARTTASAPSTRASRTRIDSFIGSPRTAAPQPPPPPRRIAAVPQLARLGHDQAAEAEAEVEGLVDVGRLLGQDVLAHDPQIGGPIGDVGGNVGRLEEEQLEPARLVFEDEPA